MVRDDPPARYSELFAIERARLVDLLRNVGGQEWSRPSPCPGWTVLGLCTHLVGDDLSILARHRDDHAGTIPPPGASEPEFIVWLDDLQNAWVKAAGRLSPRLVIDLLEWAGPQIVDYFRDQDSRSRSAHVSWAATDSVPVWLDQARELSEFWIHRQQLRHALGQESDVRTDLLGPILEGLRWAYPFRLAEVRAEPGDSVSIEVSGPSSALWHLVSGSNGWEFQASPGSRLVATLAVTTEQAWRLLTNNLPPIQQRELAISGDEPVVEVLRRTRAIVGLPI